MGRRLMPQARLTGPMPWVVAIMIALTVISLAAGLALSNVAGTARSQIAGGLTVQIVEAAPAARNRQAETALSILSDRKDVASVHRVPKSELDRLLEPWLGSTAENDQAIPMPALIDVRLAGPATAGRVDAIRNALKTAVPSARVDAQARWLGPVFGAIAALQWLAIGLIVLLAAASIAAVWLAARSALGANHETIETIHHLGATDSQIAGIFQRSIAIDALFGGVAGLLLGLAAILVLGARFAQLGSGLVSGGGLTAGDWIAIALVPLAGVLLALLTARFTVMTALQRML